MNFTPQSSRARLEIVDNPRLFPGPFLMLRIRIVFSEVLDEHEGNAGAEVCLAPIAAWREELDGEFEDLSESDGSVFYRSRDRIVSLSQVIFGRREQGVFCVQIRAIQEGQQEESVWDLSVNYDEAQFDSVEKEFLLLCEGRKDT